MNIICEKLFANKDEKFADFQAKLIPGVGRDKIIGVRTPIMRALAKELLKDDDLKNDLSAFLSELPHKYFDENIMHGELISKEKDFNKAVAQIERFLPYVDNWAVCDLLAPKVFEAHIQELFALICKWLKSERVYTVRFGIDMMIKHFLDGEFEKSHLDLINNARGDDYYVKMAKAWYFSFALIKQYDAAFEYLYNAKINANMDGWTFKKSIQKAKESYRVSDEHKQELQRLLKHE